MLASHLRRLPSSAACNVRAITEVKQKETYLNRKKKSNEICTVIFTELKKKKNELHLVDTRRVFYPTAPPNTGKDRPPRNEISPVGRTQFKTPVVVFWFTDTSHVPRLAAVISVTRQHTQPQLRALTSARSSTTTLFTQTWSHINKPSETCFNFTCLRNPATRKSTGHKYLHTSQFFLSLNNHFLNGNFQSVVALVDSALLR